MKKEMKDGESKKAIVCWHKIDCHVRASDRRQVGSYPNPANTCLASVGRVLGQCVALLFVCRIFFLCVCPLLSVLPCLYSGADYPRVSADSVRGHQLRVRFPPTTVALMRSLNRGGRTNTSLSLQIKCSANLPVGSMPL